MIRFTKSLMLTPTQCFVSNKSCTCNKMFSYLRYVFISCPFEPMDFVNSVVHIRQSPLYDSYKYRPVLLKYSPSGISKVSQWFVAKATIWIRKANTVPAVVPNKSFLSHKAGVAILCCEEPWTSSTNLQCTWSKSIARVCALKAKNTINQHTVSLHYCNN